MHQPRAQIERLLSQTDGNTSEIMGSPHRSQRPAASAAQLAHRRAPQIRHPENGCHEYCVSRRVVKIG